MCYLWIYLSKKNCEIFVNIDEGEVGWCGQSMHKVVCLQDYSRTCSCEPFKPTWVLSHTFRYNTQNVVLFSLRFSEQVHRNLWAAMLVSHSQHHGVNPMLPSTHRPCKAGSKSWTAQVNFCLHLPMLENMQVTFSYSYTWNTGGTQQITQQRAAPMYLLPAQEMKWGLEWGTRRDTCSTHPQDWLSHHSTRSLGTSQIYNQWQVLGLHVNVYLHRSMCQNTIQKQPLQPTLPQAGGQVTHSKSLNLSSLPIPH